MAYMEEVILEEPILFPLESLLFTVPDNWQPPIQFPTSTSASGTIHHAQEDREETTCIIEEEFLHHDPTEELRMTEMLRAAKDWETAQEDFGEVTTVCGFC
jgi:hypothetical protein